MNCCKEVFGEGKTCSTTFGHSSLDLPSALRVCHVSLFNSLMLQLTKVGGYNCKERTAKKEVPCFQRRQAIRSTTPLKTDEGSLREKKCLKMCQIPSWSRAWFRDGRDILNCLKIHYPRLQHKDNLSHISRRGYCCTFITCSQLWKRSSTTRKKESDHDLYYAAATAERDTYRVFNPPKVFRKPNMNSE